MGLGVWETMQRQTAEGAVESEQRIVLSSAAVSFNDAVRSSSATATGGR